MASSVPALPPLNGSKKKARRLDPAKAKARREEANPPAVFTHFTLNKDPECSKYMPYDEVAYPQLERPLNREQQYGEMETMWLQGFLTMTTFTTFSADCEAERRAAEAETGRSS